MTATSAPAELPVPRLPAFAWERLLGRPARRLDRTYLEMYFVHLLGEYDALRKAAEAPGNEHLAEQARAIALERKSMAFDWYDIFDLEAIILRLQPLETLRRRAWMLREKYRQAVPPATYDAYLQSQPPEAGSADAGVEADLRADLLRLLREFHWQYGITVTREKIRGSIALYNIRLLAIVSGLGLGSLFLPDLLGDRYRPFPAVFGVFIAGMIGGFVSTQLRLQASQPSGSEPVTELVQLNQGRLSITFSPILGGIFAVILFVLLAGGLVQGDLFPTIAGPASGALDQFWRVSGTASAVDAAKLLIWSFLAGFAERLVPDALQRIASTPKENPRAA